MSTGLTRRRGGGGGGADNEDQDNSRVSSPIPKSGGSRDIGGPDTSYENSENGHKIAFDPRDINESAERSKQPKLTLMEEVLLLGLKDKQVWGPTIAYRRVPTNIDSVHRATYHSGTITYLMLCAAVL